MPRDLWKKKKMIRDVGILLQTWCKVSPICLSRDSWLRPPFHHPVWTLFDFPWNSMLQTTSTKVFLQKIFKVALPREFLKNYSSLILRFFFFLIGAFNFKTESFECFVRPCLIRANSLSRGRLLLEISSSRLRVCLNKFTRTRFQILYAYSDLKELNHRPSSKI